MIEIVWILCALLAVAAFAVLYIGTKPVIDPLDSTSFLSSEPPFEHLHCDSGLHEIHWSKLYQTESGLDVVILTTNKPGPFPVAGYIRTTGALLQWNRYGGTQNAEPGLDLVEVCK